MFDEAALEAVVARTLNGRPEIPEDAHGAFLTVCNESGIKAVIALRVGDGWRVDVSADVAWRTRAVKYGVTVAGTF